jgi:TetR/AcrR family transcriptional regulator, regulator of mycofactocin system
MSCHQRLASGKADPGGLPPPHQHRPDPASRRRAITDLRERNRVDNRAATVDAAFALFAERGYCYVTVADICDAAGIGRRTFFRYFASKDDVLTEPSREMTARAAAAITSAPAEMPEPQVLRHALTEIATYALSHRTRLHQLAEVRTTSADIRWSPLARLSEQEQRLARQLAARRGTGAAPSWPTRLLVARAVAGLRVWLDDITGGDCADPWRHLQQIFDADPLLASATSPQEAATRMEHPGPFRRDGRSPGDRDRAPHRRGRGEGWCLVVVVEPAATGGGDAPDDGGPAASMRRAACSFDVAGLLVPVENPVAGG